MRMVPEHGREYPSRRAAVFSVFPEDRLFGPHPELLGEKAEVDGGPRAGVPNKVAQKLTAPKRENGGLRQANEILRKASTYSPRRSSTAH